MTILRRASSAEPPACGEQAFCQQLKPNPKLEVPGGARAVYYIPNDVSIADLNAKRLRGVDPGVHASHDEIFLRRR